MLTTLESSDDGALFIRWEGAFGEKAFKKALKEFVPELKTRDKMNIYLEVVHLEGVEAKAIWEDLKFYFRNIQELTEKIDRIALVSDISWIKNLTDTAYLFIPGIKLKYFTMNESKKAASFVMAKG